MSLRSSLVAILLVLASMASSSTLSGAAPAGGFTDNLVAEVERPTALAFTPDGRMLITTQTGQVRVHSGGSLVPAPALDLSGVICSDRERGLLGVAVHPGFAANHYVYLYYTMRRGPDCPRNVSSPSLPVNRVARFTLGDDNRINPASQLVLVDNIPSPSGYHNGGDLQFGNDGLLYISVGDGGCDYAGDSGCQGQNNATRDRHVLLGKILRITDTGAIPAANPFRGSDSARCNITGRTAPSTWCQETFAWGLRNPFRIAFDPNAADTRFFINDVGQGQWEEIDLGQAGADYGWNIREGHCARASTTDCGAPPAGMTNPIYDYARDNGCISITGGAFVPGNVWGGSYAGGYIFSDLGCGMFLLKQGGGGGFSATPFMPEASSVISMRFGPAGGSQALYYATFNDGGQIRRLSINSSLSHRLYLPIIHN